MQVTAWGHEFEIKGSIIGICKTCNLPIIDEESSVTGSTLLVNSKLEFYLLDDIEGIHEICTSFPTFFSSRAFLEPEVIEMLQSR